MMVIGLDHALAQLAATLAFADVPATACRILLFSEVSAATGSTPAGAPPLASIELAKPCGTIAGGVLSLSPAEPGGALVMQTGVPRAAHWLRGDGVLVAAGTVTDSDNGGDFVVAGAATAPGETSPTLYAGGKVLLGAVALT